jgi:DNA-nicking Smr family endonuclease
MKYSMELKSNNKHEFAVNEDNAFIMPIDGVLDLHTFSPKDLENLIDDYFEACLHASIFELRIIHGKGKGVLRKRVYSILERHQMVDRFEQASENSGGWGAVLIHLKRPAP